MINTVFLCDTCGKQFNHDISTISIRGNDVPSQAFPKQVYSTFTICIKSKDKSTDRLDFCSQECFSKYKI